jgi:hypothetical protein
MKRSLTALIFILFLMPAASCGSKKPIPVSDISAFSSDGPAAIVWDNYSDFEGNDPAEGKAAQALNERFGVTLKTNLYSYKYDITVTGDDSYGGGLERVHKEQIENGTLPDIFNAGDDEELFIESGTVRTIPWKMIETYAPGYAAALNGNKLLKTKTMKNENETYTLLGLETVPDMLTTFSIYRYDWLEEFNFPIPGNIKQIADYIYFTDAAFTQEEFVTIMNAFSNQPDEERVGFSANAAFTSGTDTLMGMFGLNWDNIYEGGKPVLSVASESFYTYLAFMESLFESGALSRKWEYGADSYNIEKVGWWNTDIRNYSTLLWMTDEKYYKGDPDWSQSKLLLAPPEIGGEGRQGASSPLAGEMLVKKTYMIDAKVKEEKLAKILEIFDRISYDEEFYVLTKLGVEGEDYTWSGEPYNSKTETIEIDDERHIPHFNTGTTDGNAGKHIYEFWSEDLYRFAAGAEARAMRLLPYKTDTQGEYADEFNALLLKYNKTPYEIVYEYYGNMTKAIKDDQFYTSWADYLEAVSKDTNVYKTWNDYIKELEANGLAEYNELIAKYPETNQ